MMRARVILALLLVCLVFTGGVTASWCPKGRKCGGWHKPKYPVYKPKYPVHKYPTRFPAHGHGYKHPGNKWPSHG